MTPLHPVARSIVRPRSILTAVALACASIASAVASPVYLVGAQLYAAGETGENRGGPYQFSTNSSTTHAYLTITGSQGSTDRNLAMLLSEGTNAFTFGVATQGDSTSIVGLNLFFSDVATPYNPAYQMDTGIAGNLTVFAVARSGGFFGTPLAGTNVASYSNTSTLTNATSYSGATTYQVGGEFITISQFSAATDPSGTFTLTVRPADVTPAPGSVPEPASVALLGVGIVGLGLSRRLRRRQTH